MKIIARLASTLLFTVWAAHASAAPVPLLQNGGFESNLSGWTWSASGGLVTVRTSDPNAYEGSHYIYGQNAAEFHLWQVIDLGANGVDLNNLDLGNDTVGAGGWQAGWNNTPDFGQISVEFLDAGQTSIDAHTTSPITTNHTWVHRYLNLSVPPGTRYITYHFHGIRNDGGNTDAYLDAAYLNYSAVSPITAADIVTVGAKEWAQPDLFTNLSWSDIDAVCPGGVCGSGSLNDYEMNGWSWASVDELNALFNHYLSAQGVSDTDLLGPGPDTYDELDSSWAPSFFTSAGWRPTSADLDNSILNGYTSIFDIGSGAYHGALVHRLPIGSSDDRALTAVQSNPANASPTTGAWFYRSLPDADGDDVPDDTDNCPADPNPDQINTDGADDGGDACDDDDDNDGWADLNDNCPLIANPNPQDGDGDGVGNACDNCRIVSNPGQEDADENGCGDPCEGSGCGGPFCMNPEP